MTSYALLPDQEKAVAALERALKKCAEAGVYLWDNYGTINAVNGRVLSAIVTENTGEALDEYEVRQVANPKVWRRSSRVWRGSNADDPLFVER